MSDGKKRPITVVKRLLNQYPIVSDQVESSELQVVLSELEAVMFSQTGTVVEFGCYIGTSSLFIRRLLDFYNDERAFHVYDSFEGLPDKSTQDNSPVGEQFVPGVLTARKKDFLMQFKKAGLRSPIVHKGWFSDLTTADVPKRISFAFLDGDYYQSIAESLRLIERSLTPGSVVVVDDYANESLPGAAKATDEWAAGRSCQMQVVASLAVIRCK